MKQQKWFIFCSNMEITVFRRFWFTQLNVFSCKIFDFQSTTNWILCYFFNIASKKSVFWYVRVCQSTHCLHWWPYIWQQFNSTNDCYLKLSLEIAIYIKFWTLSVFSSAFLTLSPLPPPPPPPSDEIHLDVVRRIIQWRGFAQCVNKESSWERRNYIQQQQTDLLYANA